MDAFQYARVSLTKVHVEIAGGPQCGKPTMREAYKPTMQEAYKPTMREAYNAGGHMQVVCRNPEHISEAKNVETPECFPEECYKCYMVCGYHVTKVR